jgi:hypothetical protein
MAISSAGDDLSSTALFQITSLIFSPQFFDFLFRCLQVGDEFRVGVQAGHGCCAHQATGNDIALPVNVAYDAALAERPSAVQDQVGILREQFAEDEGPGQADGRMP